MWSLANSLDWFLYTLSSSILEETRTNIEVTNIEVLSSLPPQLLLIPKNYFVFFQLFYLDKNEHNFHIGLTLPCTMTNFYFENHVNMMDVSRHKKVVMTISQK